MTGLLRDIHYGLRLLWKGLRKLASSLPLISRLLPRVITKLMASA
jgi:hypothetical protein